MSCEACSAVIDCAEFGGVVGDLAPSGGFFATQDYTFLLDCPPGFLCFPGFYPRIITIPGDTIPEMLCDGGNCFLKGCLSMIRVQAPLDNPFNFRRLVDFGFSQWAQQQATCINRDTGPGPGLPAPILIPKANRTNLTNEERCFTAHCTPESSGPPVTQCVEPGQYNLTLFDATLDQILAAQAQLNANALKEATDSANGLITCGVCNTELHRSQTCAGDPSKIVSAIVPAGKYCLPVGSAQGAVDALASTDIVNQLNALLVGLSCACPGPTVNGFQQVSNTCLCIYTWTVNGVGQGNVNIGTNFDAPSQYLGDHGFPLPSPATSTLDPVTCPGGRITAYYP